MIFSLNAKTLKIRQDGVGVLFILFVSFCQQVMNCIKCCSYLNAIKTPIKKAEAKILVIF